MGTFFQSIGVAATTAGPFQTVEALVDTGATYTWLPASLLARLGVSLLFGRRFSLANGATIERPVAQVAVRLDGVSLFTICIFGDEGSSPLLGAVTLEEFGLGVDPVNRRLVPVPGFLV